MEIQRLKIELPNDVQIILGQSHFIKTVEDVSECLVTCVPNIKFGIGFCEASGTCLVRHAGNDADLDTLATDYAYKLSADHSIVVLIRDAYPINVLTRLKEVSVQKFHRCRRTTKSFKLRSSIITIYLYALVVIQICLIIESDH
jgi:hypothetical protein